MRLRRPVRPETAVVRLSPSLLTLLKTLDMNWFCESLLNACVARIEAALLVPLRSVCERLVRPLMMPAALFWLMRLLEPFIRPWAKSDRDVSVPVSCLMFLMPLTTLATLLMLLRVVISILPAPWYWL